jgi:hypothetical protein
MERTDSGRAVCGPDRGGMAASKAPGNVVSGLMVGRFSASDLAIQ